MIMHRLGLATLALLLSACSTTTQVLEEKTATTPLPSEMTNTTHQSENHDTLPIQETPNDQTVSETMTSVKSKTEQAPTEFTSNKTLNQNNEQERQNLLNKRAELSDSIQFNAKNLTLVTGKSFSIGHSHRFDNQQEITTIQDDIQHLQNLAAAIQREQAQLEKRIETRKLSPNKADLIQVYLSEATVAQGNHSYQTMPLVGEWTRGESRMINIKDKELFNSDSSEKIAISFTEGYQLLINGQSVINVDAKTNKKEANFNVSNDKKSAIITGKIDYKLK